MKIGYIVETPVTVKNKRLVGGQISFLCLMSEIIKLNIVPYVVVSEEWELTRCLQEMQINYITTPIHALYTPLNGVYKQYHGNDVQERDNKKSFRIIKKYFSDNRVELIHINSEFCGLIGAQVAKTLNIPYIYHVREFLGEDFGLEFKNKQLAIDLIGDASYLIAISNSVCAYLRILYPYTDIVTIYNGVNEKRFNYPNKVRFDDSVIRIALVGRVVEFKGQFDAIRAIEKVCLITKRKVELLIVGFKDKEASAYENMLQDYVIKHSLSNTVHFIPFTDKVEDILKTCDIGLMCSKKEAFGRVTVEYMMSSMLAIGTNTGGTPEIIRDGLTGLLYKEGDINELVNKLLWAIDNIKSANEIILKGHDMAIENFSNSAYANNVFEVYNNVLNHKNEFFWRNNGGNDEKI